MNYHIVRTNETIEKIALMYNLTVSEIKSINQHIRSWSNLIPGTKLRLPEIPESVSLELTDVEPFIEDYYPKLNKETLIKPEEPNEVPRTPPEEEVIPVSNDSVTNNVEPKEKATINAIPYQPYYQYPYGYYPYGYYYPVQPRPQLIRSVNQQKPQRPS